MKSTRFIAVCLSIVLLVALVLPAQVAGASGYYNANYLESYAAAAYNEADLGAKWSPTETTWKVWSPTAMRVQVRLYKTGSDSEENAGVIGTYSMTKNNTTGVWSLTLSGDYQNVYYTYLVTNRGITKETRDVYAKAAGVNGYRSMVVNFDNTDPEGWNQDAHVLRDENTDAIIWEIHIRDFSISATSGVSEENRGKYLAFTEGNTTLNGTPGEVSTCLNYLKEMGVNTVQLVPVYDFGSVDETITNDPTNRNWGYDPINYNLPEGSYSTNPYDGNVRIKEFKQMVKALHDAGITVVMDVVYNHTYDVDTYAWGARLLYNNAFNDTVPGYYFRMQDSTHWINGSGCGNVTASDKKMFQKYMVESVTYWAEEYHIDGFRFDLMGCHDVNTMNLIRSKLDTLYSDGSGKKILMYGEPWIGGDDAGISNGCTQGMASALSDRIAMFCDTERDSIKGSTWDEHLDRSKIGWIQGDNSKTDVIWGGLTASADLRLDKPSRVLTYADCHDNMCLWDKIVFTNGGDDYKVYGTNELSQLRLAETILMVSQGMQFQNAGTEFARNKKGNHNSYNAPDDVNAIDWSIRKTNKESADYYKGLIAIRKAFSPFTDSQNHYSFENLVDYSGGSNSLIAFAVNNNAANEWSKVVVILNNSTDSKTVNLPAGTWNIAANGVQAGLNSLGEASGTYTVSGRGSAILYQGTYNAPAQMPAELNDTIILVSTILLQLSEWIRLP